MPSAPVSPTRRRSFWPSFAWAVVVLGALAFLFVVNRERMQRVDYVSGSPYWSVDAPVADANSATGYAGNRRHLIVPGHHAPGYFWIMRTQQAVTGNATPHRVAYDNFPTGRTSLDTSPYRWWLVGVAWLDHAITGRSLPLAVEHSARYADPLLHGLLVLGAAILAGWQFGGLAAAAVALALATFFPLAGNFQPGAPDHHALAWALVVASVLPLLAAMRGNRRSLMAVLAGIAAGLALWNDCLTGEALLLGIFLGGLGAAWLQRSAADAILLPWRAWGLALTATCLVAWLVEYFPDITGSSLHTIHPGHILVGLGLGELLRRIALRVRKGARRLGWRDWAAIAVAGAMTATVPVLRLLAKDGHFLADDPLVRELANLPNAARGAGLATWLPLLVAVFAVPLILSRRSLANLQAPLALAFGPVLITLILACLQPRWWNGCDAALVVLLVVVVTATEALAVGWRWAGRGLAVVLALPGLSLLPPPAGARGDDALGPDEVLALLERDLAHWLTHRHGAEPVVAFTTPALSEALAYYGDIKSVVSYDPANEAGLAAATRVASASSPSEALALLENRGVTHVLLPSWDPTLQRFAMLGRQLPSTADLPSNTLVAQLGQWSIPSWLRPMPHHVPADLGGNGYRVQVLALQPADDEVLALCRTVDALVEMNLLPEAAAFRERLRLYPRSLPALTALAQLAQAVGDRAGYEETLQTLLPYASRRAGRTLAIDRRISLAALLIQAKQVEATRDQMQQCLAALNTENLRTLTTGEIVRLLALADILKLPVEPQLRVLALSLVPPTLRARLEKSAAP